MDFVEFEDVILKKLKEAFPDLKIEKQTVQVVNAMVPTISIESHGVQLRMNVNEMHELHDRMNKETFWVKLIRNTKEALQETQSTKEFAEKLKDLDFVRDKLIIQLMDCDKNEEFLKEIAHTKFLDMAVTYRVIFEDKSTFIPVKVLKTWGIDVHALHEMAVENSRNKYPLTWDTMAHTLQELTGIETPEFLDNMPIWVATNSMKYMGASVMFYPEFKEQLRNDVGRCYIIPSSQHELIVEPFEDNSKNTKDIRDLIKHINATTVPLQEVLTDTVYMYDPATDAITILS